MSDSTPETVPAWPHIEIREHPDGRITVDGQPIHMDTDPHASAVAAAAETARSIGRPIRTTATDADGTRWPLIVHPDGTATEAGDPVAPDRPRRGLLRRTRPTLPYAELPAARARINACANRGLYTDALRLAAELTNRPLSPTDALHARELHAYLLYEAGHGADAATAYARLATDAAADPLTRDQAERIAENAHYVWLRLDPADARSAGAAVLATRIAVYGPDHPRTHSVRTRMDRLSTVGATA